MLTITNLWANVDQKKVLQGINLEVKAGEIHAIMGPNGSGKSTLAGVLVGKPTYTVTAGSVYYLGHDLLAMSPEKRAQVGLFLAFQYPVEIPGVSNIYFLKTALNAIRAARHEQELDAVDFLERVRGILDKLGLSQDFLYRSLNEGFSGGEKKRNELVQMAILEPKLAILDEADSGLDVDSLKVVAQGINSLRSRERSMIIITHYQRLLDYVTPDAVHVLHQGKIIQSGDFGLAQAVEKHGYGDIAKQ